MSAYLHKTIALPPEPIALPRRASFNGGDAWHYLVFFVVASSVILPLVLLILGSFSSAKLVSDFSLHALTFKNYIAVWLNPATYAVISNTVIYVAGATITGIGLALLLAWLVERTNIPGKIWIYAGVPMTLAMPGMLQAIAYVLMLSPRIGFINKALAAAGIGPINIYSLGGMIFVEGLRLVPTAFIMLVPLLRAMDPSLEEAAAMSGASPRSTLRKVTVRIMLPGLVAIGIYQFMTALEVFEVPGILGLPASIYVMSTKVYQILQSATGIPDYGLANAFGMAYVALAVVTTWGYSRVIMHQERFTIVTGKGYRPRVTNLGKWKPLAVGLVVLFLIFSIFLPFLILLYVSFIPFLQAPSMHAFSLMTLKNYNVLFHTPRVNRVMSNTLILVTFSATVTVALSFLVSIIVVRSKFWGRKILDQLVFLPHAIPGIVLGLAFVWVFLQGRKIGIDIYGTIWALALVFIISFMSYGTRAMNAAILQIHKDMEEAAYVSGAVRWRTMWRIFFPLMLPSFLGVWIWCLLQAIRQASLPLVLLQSGKNEVLSVMIWYMWDEGQVGVVGAIGTLLIVALLAITLGLRAIGFGRRSWVQGEAK